MEEKTFKQRFTEALNSQEGEDIKKLIAFTVSKTETVKDDEIIENLDEAVEILADQIQDLQQPVTIKEAKESGFRMLEKLAAHTETKWDDRIVKILKAIF